MIKMVNLMLCIFSWGRSQGEKERKKEFLTRINIKDSFICYILKNSKYL
jgi:hypothetical protein